MEIKLRQELQRDPKESEIAKALGISEEALAALRNYQQQPASLDLPIGEEEDTSIGDFVPATNMQSNPEKSAVYSSLCDALEKAMDSLTEREREMCIRDRNRFYAAATATSIYCCYGHN